MSLTAAARDLAALLRQRDLRVVFAESCTAGLAAASLARVPGISQWLCGSAVTYRDDTKVRWLQVASTDIAQHSAVSAAITRQMACGVLASTPEADWSASVTGHLGPRAPADSDGMLFMAVAHRHDGQIECLAVEQQRLTVRGRVARQREAATRVLQAIRQRIEAS